jgi:O-antigen/teichoic acid export membrane protein
VLLIVFHQFSLFNFIFAQTLALFISLLVSVYVVYIIGQPTLHPFNKNHLFDILKESYPFAILGVLMSIYYRIDAVMIEQLLPNGKEQAGIYAAILQKYQA